MAMAEWKEVVVPRGSYRFPNACAGCLRPASGFLAIPSDTRKFKGYSVPLLVSKFEYLQVQIPLCKDCGQRRDSWTKLGKVCFWGGMVGGIILGFPVGSWLDIDSRLAVLAIGLPPILLGVWLLFEKEWVVRVKEYTEETVTLSFKNLEYADQFTRLNQSSASGV